MVAVAPLNRNLESGYHISAAGKIDNTRLKPKFGSWIMCLAAKDAKTAKKMQSDMVFGGLYTGRQIDMISPTG